jgi:hypothetical protein
VRVTSLSLLHRFHHYFTFSFSPPNPTTNNLEAIFQILQSNERLSQADKDMIQVNIEQVRDYIPPDLTLVLASINSTGPRCQNNRQIQGLGLLSSILQDKLRTLERKRESVLQELKKTLNEIDITKMQLGK